MQIFSSFSIHKYPRLRKFLQEAKPVKWELLKTLRNFLHVHVHVAYSGALAEMRKNIRKIRENLTVGQLH